eukprot:gene7985-10799_t
MKLCYLAFAASINARVTGLGLLDPTCCDPLYRKAIRVSVGGVLRVPYARLGEGEDLIGLLARRDFTPVALSPSGETALSDLPPLALPAPKPRVGEMLAAQRAKKIGVPVIPIHRAVLTVKQDAANIPAKLHPGNPTAQRILAEAMRARAACFWATDCGRGCSIKANYQSTTVHLPPAIASGGREVTVDENGKATGIAFIDKATGEE